MQFCFSVSTECRSLLIGLAQLLGKSWHNFLQEYRGACAGAIHLQRLLRVFGNRAAAAGKRSSLKPVFPHGHVRLPTACLKPTRRQVQIVVAQADLAAVIIAVDLIVSVCTTHMFLRSKESVGAPVVAEEGEESEDLVCKSGDDARRADEAL